MKSKTQSELRIERLCMINRFSTQIVKWKSKKILDAYREAKKVKEYSRKDEGSVISCLKAKVREKYDKSYVMKVNHKTGSLDYMLLDVIGTKWAENIIDKVFAKMCEFDEDSDDYCYILTEYYLSENKREDIDIQDEMEVSYSKYYRLKKNAILLFGILLWLTVLDECIDNSDTKDRAV